MKFDKDVRLLNRVEPYDFRFTADGVQLIDCHNEELTALFEYWLKREAGMRFNNGVCTGRDLEWFATALMHRALFYENQINPRVARLVRRRVYAEEIASSRASLTHTDMPEDVKPIHQDWIAQMETMIAEIDAYEAKCQCKTEWCDCPLFERRQQETEGKAPF